MRIQHNISALNSYRQLNGNNNALAKNLEKLSSGYKINRAGDDAAGLAISEKMRSQIKGLEAATKNANDTIGLIQTAEGALTEVHSMLNRMVYLATQSANGTYDETERGNLQAEVDELIKEIDRISDETKFSQKKLLNGEFTADEGIFQIGASSTERITVSIVDMASTNLGAKKMVFADDGTVTYEALTEGKAKNQETINGLEITDIAKANSAIDIVNGAIDMVSQMRAKLGATQNRMEHTVNNLGVMTENITAAESRIRDTDMADEMTAYTKNNILVQAAQAMLAQANTVPQGVLQLLQ